MYTPNTSRLRWSLSIFAILISAFAVKAGHDYTFDNEGTDYHVKISMANGWTSYCDCSNNNTVVQASKGSFGNSNVWFNHSYSSGSSSLSYTHVVGPSFYGAYYITNLYSGKDCNPTWAACGACNKQACSRGVQQNGIRYGYTVSIKKPTNVNATDGVSDTYVIVTWDKGTDIPDANHSYNIYRNTTLIATVNGDIRTYKDSMLNPGSSYTYRVTTFTNAFGTGNHESSKYSSGAYDVGTTFSMNLTATDFEHTSRTLLRWNDVSTQAEEIELSRIDGTDTVQIGVVSKFSRQFSDYDGIPGYTYTYMVKPVKNGAVFLPDFNIGTRRENGVIKGKVLSPLNAGVVGVTVHAISTVDVNGTPVSKSYTATTDASGYYEMKDVYYYKDASYTIYPEKPRHLFKPDTLTRKLDLDNPKLASVDFTDTTVFTIIGYVQYPIEGGASTSACGIQGVRILLNGNEITRTDPQGRYSFVVQDEGTYKVSPRYLHHQFDVPDTNLLVEDNVLDLRFNDIEKDTIFVKVQGGCGASLADSVEVRIKSTKDVSCYDTTIYTNPNGLTEIVLAAREYKVEVTDLFPVNSNIFYQIGNKPLRIDLTSRDSLQLYDTAYTVDTIVTQYLTLPNGQTDTIVGYFDTIAIAYDTTMLPKTPRAEFIYRAPISIDINWADVADNIVCMPKFGGGTESVPMMEKGGNYGITIDIYETASGCPVKEGRLRLYDYVSDLDKNVQILPFVNGRTEYLIQAGNPQIAGGGKHPNQKLFYMLAEVGFLDPIPSESWLLVTGSLPRDKTFTTRSAGIPFLVLHDPPGDQSYAYVEKGSTFSTFTNTQSMFGGSGGVQSEIRLGSAVKTPFSENKLGVAIDIDMRAGRDNNDKTGTVTSLTFSERFSTSQAEALTGYPGDVFVGAAFNMLYSLADAIDYDAGSCNVTRDTILAIDPVGFATTFIYTEDFLTQVLIPNLTEIKRLAPADSAVALQVDIDNWKRILADNRVNRDSLAIPVPGSKGNISISTGATYDNEMVFDTVTSGSYEYQTFFNREVFLGLAAGAKSGVWNETKAGVVITATNSYSSETGGDTTQTRTVGYHIEDNDRGDYHSIDILKDVANGVPAFRLAGGATSCPHEPNTQRRYLSEISIYPPERNNVPSTGSASFTVNLVNNSQSDESQTYAVRVLPESNLDGAIIKIGGTVINNSPAYYTIPPRQIMQVKLTVERGPLATSYKGLEVLISAGCEWDDLYELTSADVVTFDVNFQSECSSVGIYRPVDNWVQNTSHGDYLDMAFSNYDANDPNLESLILEYRRAGKGWEEAVEVPKDSLIQKFYDIKVLTKHWPDGEYQLRAMANCRDKISQIRYSDIVPGKVDRSPIALFGQVYPSDGILNVDDDIMVEFDKFIDQSISYLPGKIALQRNDTKAFIPITYSIKDGSLIIQTSPISLLDSLEGVELTAIVNQIEDLSGNVLTEPIVWSFIVNRSPVFWAPRSIVYDVVRGVPGSFTGTLKNVGPSASTFTITQYPLWLIPSTLSGSVNGLGGTTDIGFALVNDINPGVYIDTVIAESGGYKLALLVRIEVVSPAPRWVNENINPADFQYNMSGIFQFSTTTTNTPLSEDTKDAIGVFINDSLRGRGYIQYVPQLRTYMAFVTIYSNTTEPDSLQFRMWDASPGIQYLALESKAFNANSLLGQAQSPFVLHPGGVFQTINLTKGWNWFSLFVKSGNPSANSLMASATKDSLSIIKTRDEYIQFNQDIWEGDFDSLAVGEGYMMNVPEADTVEIYGDVAGPIHSDIEGNNNWSWVGNTDLFGSSVNEKLQNLSSEDGDIIKSKDAFAVFEQSSGNWVGSLSYFDPGSAYKIRTKVPGEFKTTKFFKTLPNWNLSYAQNEYNMSITSEILRGSQPVMESHFLVGAFVNGVCQGIGQPIYSKTLDRFVIYLTAFGDTSTNGKPIELRLYDTDLGSEITISHDLIDFAADGISGAVAEPFALRLLSSGIQDLSSAQSSMLCYPNPFDDGFNIQLNLPIAAYTDLYVVDITGRRVVDIFTGDAQHGETEYTVALPDLAKGVYYCVANVNGQILKKVLLKQ